MKTSENGKQLIISFEGIKSQTPITTRITDNLRSAALRSIRNNNLISMRIDMINDIVFMRP